MPDSIRVHQALFGYREGHNLLGASVSLPPKIRHFLATMTDASGNETAPGFDCSYTGLPVPQTDFYAVFRTWPAPEMPRPGCVWSHVLLVELTDLARIRNLGCLRDLTRRPKSNGTLAPYEQPVDISEQLSATTIAVAPGTEAVIVALYGEPDKGVVVLVDDPEPWEKACFALWSQQWPRLRRNFAFSTGSLSDRRQTDINFDLQIAPISTARLWRRNSIPTKIIEPSAPSQESAVLKWLQVAIRDLEYESQRPSSRAAYMTSHDKSTPENLREFLYKYGSDIEKPRSAFARLVTSYQELSGPETRPWEEILVDIGRNFPNKVDAVRLKEHLVTVPQTAPDNERLERAWAIASFLLSAPEAQAYAQISFNHGEWATGLWHHKRQGVLSLFARLVRHPEKPTASEFAKAIAEALDAEDLPLLASQNPELIPIFISHKPTLAQSPKAWELNCHIQWQIYETLESQELDELAWSRVEAAMFIAATSTAVQEVVGKAGGHAMDGAFLWFESVVSQQLLPAQNWRKALAEPATRLLEEGKSLNPAQLALCCWLAPADEVRRLVVASRQDIQTLARQFHDSVPKPLREHTAFVLVTVGLREPTAAGAEPLVSGFFDAHDSLARSSYSPESWRILAPELPRLGVWRDWDRCEKLRRAVRDWLARSGDQHPLMNAADTNEHRKLAARISEADTDDEEFLD